MSTPSLGGPREAGLMGDPVASFRRGLQAKVLEIERYALAEVERMGKTLAKLEEENTRLRSQLSNSAVDSYALEKAEPRSDLSNGATGSYTPERAEPRTPESRLVLFRQSSVDSVPGTFQSGESRRSSVIDTAQVKRRLTQQRKPREYNVKDQYKSEGRAQLIARSAWFENLSHFIVLLNAIWIWVDMDFNGKPLLQSPFIFQFVEFFFVVIFSLEMVVRFLAFKQKRSALFDRWFVFDTMLVSIMVFESVVLSFILWVTSSAGTGSFGILSALRILRLLRLARVARLCQLVPELRTMVSGMLAGIRSVLISGLLLFSLTYIFAIVLRQVSLHTRSGSLYFRSVPSAVYTLLIESMVPDNGPMLVEIGLERWYMGAIYFAFLILSAITIMNLLIGVLCDVVGRVSNEEKERRSLEAMSEKLQSLLKSIDKDYDGAVSKAEFEHILGNDEAIKILIDVGVDVQSLVEDADFIFSVDTESLPFDDFKEVVLEFRATSAATIRTIASLRKFVRKKLLDVGDRLAAMERDMSIVIPSLVLPMRQEI